MRALEIPTSIIDHGIHLVSDALPAAVKHAKVIVMYEEADVVTDSAAERLARARAAQSSFAKQDDAVLQDDMNSLRNEWER